jgi:hypothetical protein
MPFSGVGESLLNAARTLSLRSQDPRADGSAVASEMVRLDAIAQDLYGMRVSELVATPDSSDDVPLPLQAVALIGRIDSSRGHVESMVDPRDNALASEARAALRSATLIRQEAEEGEVDFARLQAQYWVGVFEERVLATVPAAERARIDAEIASATMDGSTEDISRWLQDTAREANSVVHTWMGDSPARPGELAALYKYVAAEAKTRAESLLAINAARASLGQAPVTAPAPFTGPDAIERRRQAAREVMERELARPPQEVTASPATRGRR